MDKSIVVTESTEVDLSHVELNADESLLTEEGLDFFEDQIVSSAETMAMARTKFAYSIYMVMEYELWKKRTEILCGEGGEEIRSPVFASQGEYLRHLSGKSMIGVSTMKSYHSALRTAKSLGFSTYEDIRDRGVYVFQEINKSCETDRKTGEPKRLKSGARLPDGYSDTKEYLRDVVNELTTPSKDKPDVGLLRPADFRGELHRRLRPHKPEIWLERRGNDINWFFSRARKDMTIDFFSGSLTISLASDEIVPDDVYQAIKDEIDSKLKARET